jgi:chemotaxis protein methyltransferase CheR
MLSPGVPALLRDLIHERTGIYFDRSQFDLMLDKLHDRVMEHRCVSYLDYFYILKYGEHGPEEWLRVVDAFSVQETYFWREMAQICALVEMVVPAWFATRSDPLRIWSAACATGEEPSTIAIALREAGWGGYPIKIAASDGSETALAKARAGIYRERSFRALPPALREKYFTACREGSRLRRELLLPISYQRANLVAAAEIAPLAAAEVIFCRNVFIYFSADSIRRTVESFAARMPPGGYLFVGASESLIKLTNRYEIKELKDAFAYVRQPSPAVSP